MEEVKVKRKKKIRLLQKELEDLIAQDGYNDTLGVTNKKVTKRIGKVERKLEELEDWCDVDI
jgi:chemotaxis regulatin CheY-phosphate phosphatase CheZ